MSDPEALLAQYRRMQRADDWRSVPGFPGIQAAIRPDSPIDVVRCTIELGLPAAQLAQYLIDDILTTLGEWNPLYLRGSDLGMEGMLRRLHLCFRGPHPLIAARDNLIRVGRFAQPDGTILELSGDDDHSRLPPKRGTVRMVLPFAAKAIHPLSPTHCRYTVIWQTDPAGLLSRVLPRRLLVRAVLNDLVGECVRLQARFPVDRAGPNAAAIA